MYLSNSTIITNSTITTDSKQLNDQEIGLVILGALTGFFFLTGLILIILKGKQEEYYRKNFPLADRVCSSLMLPDVSDFYSLQAKKFLRFIEIVQVEIIRQQTVSRDLLQDAANLSSAMGRILNFIPIEDYSICSRLGQVKRHELLAVVELFLLSLQNPDRYVADAAIRVIKDRHRTTIDSDPAADGILYSPGLAVESIVSLPTKRNLLTKRFPIYMYFAAGLPGSPLFMLLAFNGWYRKDDMSAGRTALLSIACIMFIGLFILAISVFCITCKEDRAYFRQLEILSQSPVTPLPSVPVATMSVDTSSATTALVIIGVESLGLQTATADINNSTSSPSDPEPITSTSNSNHTASEIAPYMSTLSSLSSPTTPQGQDNGLNNA